jgi:protein-disulfide isomerase
MSKLRETVNTNDHIQGKKDAKVTLVEYGDYECPYCGQAYPIVKELQKIEGTKLKFVFRNFPLEQVHPHAVPAACAAEAAAKQGKFWEMHDLLYENQEALEDNDLLIYAKELKLDIPQFTKDMESDEIKNKVEVDFMSGVRSGVNGTPTFFINGIRHDGSYELPFLKEAIAMALKTKKKGSTKDE